jgi:hypothetical protein
MARSAPWQVCASATDAMILPIEAIVRSSIVATSIMPIRGTEQK